MGLDAVGIEKTEDNYKTAAARIAELLPSPPDITQRGACRPTAAPRLYPCRVGWYSSPIQKAPHFRRRDTVPGNRAQIDSELQQILPVFTFLQEIIVFNMPFFCISLHMMKL